MKATQRPLNGHSMATQWPLHFYGVFCDPNITKQSDLYKVKKTFYGRQCRRDNYGKNAVAIVWPLSGH
jgi:hypothetical protein